MPRDALTLGRSISLFENSLRAGRKAERTINQYVRAAQMIEETLGRDCDPTTITVEDLEQIIGGWRVSATTVHNRIVAWRQFFGYGRSRLDWPHDPTEKLVLPRKDQPELRRLARAEVDALVNADHDAIELLAVRVLAFTGMRRGELMALTWSSVDLVEGLLVIGHWRAKGRKGRTIPLDPQLVTWLAQARELRGRGADDDCYVFPRRDGYQFVGPEALVRWREAPSDNAVDRAVKRTAKAAGLRNADGVTSHMFRRYLLEQMLEQGHSPYIAAALAGHSSVNTTARYGGGASLNAVRDALARTRVASATPAPVEVEA